MSFGLHGIYKFQGPYPRQGGVTDVNGRAAGTGSQRVDLFDERSHNESVNQFVFSFGPLVSGGCEELLTVSVLEVEEFLGVELDAATGEFEGQLHHISHSVVLNQGSTWEDRTASETSCRVRGTGALE